MRLLNCEVTNFGSYPHLGIDFSNTGLSLVYGKTGAGKSTIPDLACWILFGTTAKDGSVDEVRSWQSLDAPTTGRLSVELSDGTITVVRVRGKPTQNDLYWLEGDSDEKHRGKDVTDTQKRLEKRLGVSAELYLTSAYFHEFSPTGEFFTAKAKDRRAIFERIASMELAVTLSNAASSARKTTKVELAEATENHAKLEGKYEQLVDSIASNLDYVRHWIRTQAEKVQELTVSAKNFDKIKSTKIAALHTKQAAFEDGRNKEIDDLAAKINSLDALLVTVGSFEAQIKNLSEKSRCDACSGFKAEIVEKLREVENRKTRALASISRRSELVAKLQEAVDKENPYTEQIKEAEQEKNQYEIRAKEEAAKTNPFEEQLSKSEDQLLELGEERIDSTIAVKALERRVSALSFLYDLSFSLRGELLRKAVQEIEDSTNHYLSVYFDAEIKVRFAIESADDLEVYIQKSGYDCVYKQLSKGQRGLLKLCFVVSVMQAASNKAGTHFSNLFFDEALDGLDSELKVKAFSLFEALEAEHESIFLIDHAPEFQNMFSTRYRVSMVGDTSEIELEDA